MLSTQLAILFFFFKKMISFGLIPLQTAYKKEVNCSGRSQVRRILLNCIQLLLLQRVFAPNLVHAYKLRIFQKTAR